MYGTNHAEAMKATTTATMATGMAARPSVPSSSVASSTAVSGSRRSTAVIAPMPIATAGTRLIPGRWDMAMPPAAPMNIAGNTGPPRKALSETP